MFTQSVRLLVVALSRFCSFSPRIMAHNARVLGIRSPGLRVICLPRTVSGVTSDRLTDSPTWLMTLSLAVPTACLMHSKGCMLEITPEETCVFHFSRAVLVCKIWYQDQILRSRASSTAEPTLKPYIVVSYGDLQAAWDRRTVQRMGYAVRPRVKVPYPPRRTRMLLRTPTVPPSGSLSAAPKA